MSEWFTEKEEVKAGAAKAEQVDEEPEHTFVKMTPTSSKDHLNHLRRHSFSGGRQVGPGGSIGSAKKLSLIHI